MVALVQGMSSQGVVVGAMVGMTVELPQDVMVELANGRSVSQGVVEGPAVGPATVELPPHDGIVELG